MIFLWIKDKFILIKPLLLYPFFLIKYFFLQIRTYYLFPVFIISSFLSVIILGLSFGYFLFNICFLPHTKKLENYQLYQIPTVLYDLNKEPYHQYYKEKRNILDFSQIPNSVINTLIALEDKNFYSHRGIDFLGILRALVIDIVHMSLKQGGSTISQQLAKLLLTDQKRNITRKIKELFYTVEIEKSFTKEEILEKYLNKVYYGNRAYGISEAAQFYFDIPVQQLNYAQVALLMAIAPAPYYYNPLTRPVYAKTKHAIVMHKIVEEKLLTQEEANKQSTAMWGQISQDIILGKFNEKKAGHDLAPYFSEHVRQQLYDKFGSDIYTQGYQVYTTMDIDLQKKAQEFLWNGMKNAKNQFEIENKSKTKYILNKISVDNIAYPYLLEFLSLGMNHPQYQFSVKNSIDQITQSLQKGELSNLSLLFEGFKALPEANLIEDFKSRKNNLQFTSENLQGALISTEYKTGRIVSMVGGDKPTTQVGFNHVFQAQRQVGSTFKPFLYLTALKSERFTPASIVLDAPLSFNLPNGSSWEPDNSGKIFNGRVTLRTALKKSLNTVSIRLLKQLGLQYTIKQLSQILEFSPTRFPKNLSIALGTFEMSPFELNRGYATIANQGKSVVPHTIIEVRDSFGKLIWSPEKELQFKSQQQIIAPQYTYILDDMLKAVIRNGTGSTAARLANYYNSDLRGKTGTTSNMRDSWFSGYSSRFATTVWVGFSRNLSLGRGQFGGTLAGPIWMNFMREASQTYKVVPEIWPRPNGVTTVLIHSNNGLRIPQSCMVNPLPSYYIYENFISGKEPIQESPYCVSKQEHITSQDEEILDNINLDLDL